MVSHTIFIFSPCVAEGAKKSLKNRSKGKAGEEEEEDDDGNDMKSALGKIYDELKLLDEKM